MLRYLWPHWAGGPAAVPPSSAAASARQNQTHRAGESGTGESSACRSRRAPPRSEPPSPPCLKRPGLPTGEGMATPPKRSCPSPSASSEGTRIKKISIEGNIAAGKSAFVNILKQVCEDWEVVPEPVARWCNVQRTLNEFEV